MVKKKKEERCGTCQRVLEKCHCKPAQNGVIMVKKHSRDCLQPTRCACPLVPVDKIKKK